MVQDYYLANKNMHCFFTLILVIVSFTIQAQNVQSNTFFKVRNEGKNLKSKFDENSIIRDSTGAILPYNIWKNELKNGNGIIKTINDTLFTLTYYTHAEKIRADSLKQALFKDFEKAQNEKIPFSLSVGKKFPKCKARDINGELINTKSLIGKIVVFNFWFINCGPCREEIPELNNVYNKFSSDSSVVFIAMALDSKENILEFLKLYQFKYKIIDSGMFYTRQNKIANFPTNVVVDKFGKIYYTSIGYNTSVASKIEKAILDLKK
jgi:thiol-disulfide isomerase/thioredoxin